MKMEESAGREPAPETLPHPKNYRTEPCKCGHDWGSHHGTHVSPQCRWCPCMEYDALAALRVGAPPAESQAFNFAWRHNFAERMERFGRLLVEGAFSQNDIIYKQLCEWATEIRNPSVAGVPPPAAETPTGWQPIATAPKDGTKVFVIDADGEPHVAAWEDDGDRDAGFYPSKQGVPWPCRGWMPLPALAPETPDSERTTP